jgi:hypothetical protein
VSEQLSGNPGQVSEYVRITDRKIELTDEGVDALMADYTPTTGAVRTDYANVTQFGLDMYKPRYEEFDRWLAEVKAQAWEEAVRHIKFVSWDEIEILKENPYRHGENK